MLKGFKKGSGGPDAPATERDLREEREALTALLRHLDASSAPVRALADAVTALEARVAALDTRANQAARTLSVSPWASARSIASGFHFPLSFNRVEAIARKPCAEKPMLSLPLKPMPWHQNYLIVRIPRKRKKAGELLIHLELYPESGLQ